MTLLHFTTLLLLAKKLRENWRKDIAHLPAPARYAGFTLIELSIVLVIIGLIAGGVLVGQDLMQAANLRADISQVDKLNAAVNTFRLKYNCLPGDCRTATQFFGGSTQPEQVTNGNGDKRILGTQYVTYNHNNIWTRTGEWSYAMDHLAAAGLIDLSQFDETDVTTTVKPGIGFPKNNFYSREYKGSPWGATTTDSFESSGGIVFGYQPTMPHAPWHVGGHVFRFGAKHRARLTTNALGFDYGHNPWDAKRIDDKIDDGKPYSGNLTVGDLDIGDAGFMYTRVQGLLGAFNPGYCGVWGSNVYRTESNILGATYRSCFISIKAGF